MLFERVLVRVLVHALVQLYDLLSVPVFYVLDNVRAKRHELEHVPRSQQIDPSDPESPWRQVNIDQRQQVIEARIDKFDTADAMMRSTFEACANRPAYGYREVLEEHWHRKPETGDKLFRQVVLSDYKWITFAQFDHQIEAAKRGLLIEGVRCGDRVMLYADTRPEWQICAQALMRLGAVVGTMYPTLGVDGIVHSVNETQVTHIITLKDKVNKLLKLKPRIPRLTKIIYCDTNLRLTRDMGAQYTDDASTTPNNSNNKQSNNHHATTNQDASLKTNSQQTSFSNHFEEPKDTVSKEGFVYMKEFEHDLIECISLGSLMLRGELAADRDTACGDDYARLQTLESANSLECAKRHKDTTAVIMYTSGSTGVPKGVLLSHRNIQSTVKSFSYVTKDIIHQPFENVCAAYLPLAHIFEFCIEAMLMYHAVPFGFATPHTLTDKSPGLAPGQKGDLTLVKPTILIMVPLILDRIVQGVKQTLRTQGSTFREQLVTYLIEYKQYWQARHYSTPIVDKIVCSKIAAALGGRAKYVIAGSAPLSPDTQRFVRAALNLNLPQGFGTTETCAACTCQLFDDQTTDNVGVPVSGLYIKLEPWPEGGYKPTDKPNPRGEIVAGGNQIAQGYFNLDEQTREAFYTDDKGMRWYRTGDIGEFLPNGNLKIIDRKKDLVKLQNGEYISLGKVESTLKSNPYTENFCVYANSNYNYVVALGPANELALRGLAREIIVEATKRSSTTSTPTPGRRSASPTSSEQQHKSEDNKTTTTTSQQQQEECKVKPRSNGKEAEEQRAFLSAHAKCDDEQPQQVDPALEELQALLDSYDLDEANNNDDANEQDREVRRRRESEAARTAAARKMSSLSTASSCAGAPSNERLASLCANALVVERVHKYLDNMARERGLMSLEVPRKIMLLPEEWTEDKNLVTSAMKIRRNFIYKRYETQLKQLYESDK